MWWGTNSNSDTDANADTDAYSNADTNADTDANAGSKCSKQLNGDGSFLKSNQLVMDGQLKQRERL